MLAIAGRLVAAAGLIVLSVTGCSCGTETNGLENKSATEVLQAATAALKASHGVHVIASFTIDGQPVKSDLRIQDGSASGTVTIDSARVEFTRVGGDAYVRGDQQGLQAIGISAEAAGLGVNRWLKSSPQQLGWEGFASLGSFPDMPDRGLNPTVEQTELNGKKVVVVSFQDGTKLYVANTGAAYPLRTVRKGQFLTSPNTEPTSTSPRPRPTSGSESSSGSARWRSLARRWTRSSRRARPLSPHRRWPRWASNFAAAAAPSSGSSPPATGCGRPTPSSRRPATNTTRARDASPPPPASASQSPARPPYESRPRR
jgi:hypothetical protein